MEGEKRVARHDFSLLSLSQAAPGQDTMRGQACDPCAKRKVRCDREDPCSNCKRRKLDRCTYPEISPFERIKKLEAQVRQLGGVPDLGSQTTSTPTETASSPARSHIGGQYGGQETFRPNEDRSGDAVVLEEDGQPFYLDSRAWTDCHGHGSLPRKDAYKASAKNPFLTRSNPAAFEGVLSSKNPIDFASRMPSAADAGVLWTAFYQRVNPLLTISFRWASMDLESASFQRSLTAAEYAFLFAVYLIGVVSLSDDECQKALHQPRSVLLVEYQTLCEEAVARDNLFCITDILVLKALTIYMMAGTDRLSTQSLWSLMGLVVCNAEKLGIHRDGTLLGLSPAETEERRRLWWQMQHINLGLAAVTGVTPITLMADWDVKLPLNIEDEDINPNMTEFPKERKGLTSMSYCLYTYWVLQKQRFFLQSQKGRFELSWVSQTSLSHGLKGSLIEQLEEGINRNFLQYCDPIKPLDTLVQISARSLICVLRLRTLYPLAASQDSGNNGGGKVREELLEASMRSLGYNIALQSQPSIRRFQWWTKGIFPWHALMCVLVETSQQVDLSKTQEIWDLLSALYLANPALSQLSGDRRPLHAAELVVAAWKARQHKLGTSRVAEPPGFIINLENQLRRGHKDTALRPGADLPQNVNPGPDLTQAGFEAHPVEQEIDPAFDLGFQDIDWSFWSSID